MNDEGFDWDDDDSPRQSGGLSSKRLGVAGCSGLLLLVLLIIIPLPNQIGACLDGTLPSCRVLATPTPAITISNVRFHLRQAAELTTYIMDSDMELEVDMAYDILPTLTEVELEYHAYGQVRAEFDLNAISNQDIEITSEALVIQLPPPDVSAYIDANRSYVKEFEGSLLSGLLISQEDKLALVSLAQQQALEEFTIVACQRNIVGLANDQAVVVLQGLLEQASGLAVRIITQPRECF